MYVVPQGSTLFLVNLSLFLKHDPQCVKMGEYCVFSLLYDDDDDDDPHKKCMNYDDGSNIL